MGICGHWAFDHARGRDRERDRDGQRLTGPARVNGLFRDGMDGRGTACREMGGEGRGGGV